MILADDVDAFVDTFAMYSYQQQEYAIPRPLHVGDTLGVTVSWNIGGAEFEASRDLNLAIGLYKDNDLGDGIGSNELIGFGELSFDAEGVLLPAMLAGDALTRTADGAWNSAEHLYFQVDDLSQEGYYYFRVFNLSPNTDDFSLAGLIAPVPEPSTAVLAALAVCGLFAIRRRPSSDGRRA
jgi:MYXO-CTERM domain-containing protein